MVILIILMNQKQYFQEIPNASFFISIYHTVIVLAELFVKSKILVQEAKAKQKLIFILNGH